MRPPRLRRFAGRLTPPQDPPTGKQLAPSPSFPWGSGGAFCVHGLPEFATYRLPLCDVDPHAVLADGDREALLTTAAVARALTLWFAGLGLMAAFQANVHDPDLKPFLSVLPNTGVTFDTDRFVVDSFAACYSPPLASR
jgi:hypothetical protein